MGFSSLFGAVLDAIQSFVELITPVLNEIVLFFLIIFLFFFAGKILGRLVLRVLQDTNLDAAVKRSIGIQFSITRLLSSIVAGVIYVAGFFIALTVVDLATFVLWTILGIIVFALLISLFLALRDFLSNAVSGFRVRSHFRVGGMIEFEKSKGRITKAGILETVLETQGGDVIVIPNALFARQAVKVKRR